MSNENNYSYAQKQYDIISSIAKSKFDEVARNIGLIVSQVAIVATYNSETKATTVYFPSDLKTQSSPYYNLTNKELSVGQKVYIFYKYGDIEQGWIMA